MPHKLTDPPAGTCRFCSCTDTQACEGGCGWADEAETVCSRCNFASTLVEAIMPILQRLATREAPELATMHWLDLPGNKPTLMVMALRVLTDAIREDFLQAIGSEAAGAAIALAELAQFMYRTFPGEMDEADANGEDVLKVIQRLLAGAKPKLLIVTP